MKTILIIGFGKTGKAFYEHEKHRAKIAIYDDRPIEWNQPYLAYDPEMDYAYALISPGVSPAHPVWRHCVERSIPVYGEIEYASHSLQGQVIGITGTNGKTTTTTLVFEMMRLWHERSFLAGNIGFPLINYVDQSRPEDYYVTELSSFQLETVVDFKPSIGAITNITPDHIQWHGDMSAYIAAKFKLLQHVSDYRKIVINVDDAALLEALISHGFSPEQFSGFSHEKRLSNGVYLEDGQIMLADPEPQLLLAQSELKLSGLHNLENACCASFIAHLAGTPFECIQQVLREFSGIEHRYEVVGEKAGRRFINDSKATNPDSTIPALKSIERPTIWIAGGMDKGSNFRPMLALAKDRVERLILFGENHADFYSQAQAEAVGPIEIVNDLDQAFAKAIQFSAPGYDILLSPASASWDMYPNFEARGNHFKELIGAWHV